MDASQYSVPVTLRDGSAVTIRAQRTGDKDGMRSALVHMSAQSIQRRFFAPRRSFSDAEVGFFLDIDFVRQVALVADVHGVIVGGGRYIVTEPGVAEVAFSVADEWQGRGLGGLLMEHLIGISRRHGLHRLVADVLRENSAMLAVFRHCGLQSTTRPESGVAHVTLDLDPTPIGSEAP